MKSEERRGNRPKVRRLECPCRALVTGHRSPATSSSQLRDVFVGTGDDVDADDFADAAGGFSAGIDGGLDGGDIAFDGDRDQARADLVLADELDVGGLEGGITNGEPLVVRASMKPIATLRKALPSVDIRTKEVFEAAHERSDICAVAAAGVIGEAMVAIVLAGAVLEKFGGDSLVELRRNVAGYKDQLARF